MENRLRNKGVYELTRKEALGKYFSTDRNENDTMIVSYFDVENLNGYQDVIKVIFEDGSYRDFISVYFNNSNVIESDVLLEAILRGLCIQLNDSRTELKRRSNNRELSILISYPETSKEEDRERFKKALIGNKAFEEIGYEKLESISIHTGHSTKYESKRLLADLNDYEKYSRKIYEKQNDNYLEWDEYFMASAMLASMRSKDPSTGVGCCIVNKDNVKLSEGYNGTPVGWKDEYFPWDRKGDFLDTKYAYVVHSEANAITHCIGQGKSLHGARIYVTLFPCNECAKLIVQSGIKEVIYLSDKYAETEGIIASKRILDECGVTYRQLNPDKELTLRLKL